MKSLVLALVSVTALAQVPPPPPMPAPEPEQEWAQPDPSGQLQDGQDLDPNAQVAEDAEPVEMTTVASVQAFEPALAPYGDWVAANGVRAFRPSISVVGQNFQPYTSHGRWVSTEAGWSFSSTLPFGWATFHYGRWWLDPTYGWVWVPDTTWGPSWVDWRYGGGYTGWAPLPPPMFRAYYRPRWFFVGAPYFCSRDLWRYGVPAHRYDSVFNVTVGVPVRSWRGNTWYSGPAYREIAHVAIVPPVRRSMASFAPPPAFHGAVNVGGGYRGGMVPPPAPTHAMAPPPGSGGFGQPPVRSSPPPPGSGGFGQPPVRSLPPPPGNGGFVPPAAHGSPPPPGGGFIPPPRPSGGVVAPAGARSYSPPSAPAYRAPPPPTSSPSFRAPPPPSSFRSAPAPQHFSAPPPARSFSGGAASGGHSGGGHHR